MSFSGQTKKATADKNGEWSVSLDAMPANSQSAALVAETNGQQVKLNDVLVGDVFLFARQTTIDVSLGRDDAGRKAAAALPSFRVMRIDTIVTELRHQLDDAGQIPTLPHQGAQDLGMDIKRVERLVKKTEADAWVMAGAS